MIASIKKLWRSQFYQGSLFLTVSSLCVYLLNYLFNFLSARALGPSGYGEITSLFAYQYISLVPITVFSMIIIQKINATVNPFGFSKGIEDFFWTKIKQWWWLILVIIPLTPFLPDVTNLSILVSYSLVPFFLLTFLSAFYAAAMQGLRLFFVYSVITVIAAVIKLSGAVLVAAAIDGLATIILLLSISLVYTLVASYRSYHKALKKNLTRSISLVDRRLTHIFKSQQFLTTMLSILALTLLNNADIIFVKKFFSPFEAGIYSGWSLFAKIIWYLVTPILLTSFIFFSDDKKIHQHHKLFTGVLSFLIGLGLASYLCYWFFGPSLVTLLLGKEFVAVSLYLNQAAIFGSFYSLITLINNYFLAKKNKAALLLPLAMPIYLIFLFVVKKELSSIIRLNILFAVFATGLHISAYIYQCKRRLVGSQRSHC